MFKKNSLPHIIQLSVRLSKSFTSIHCFLHFKIKKFLSGADVVIMMRGSRKNSRVFIIAAHSRKYVMFFGTANNPTKTMYQISIKKQENCPVNVTALV